jgi:cytochrome c oxidase subunit 2
MNTDTAIVIAQSLLTRDWAGSFIALYIDPGAHSPLEPVSAQARSIEWLYWLVFWICLAVYLLVVAALGRASARTYTPQHTPLPVFADEEGDKHAAWVVGTAVGVTIIVLFIVLFFSVLTGNIVGTVQAKNAVTIEIIGHQWWWEVVYSNPESYLTLTTANEIHVPVGKTVDITTRSADVIHSFWVPNIAGKRDLVPGHSSTFSFEIDNAGIYRGQCAEFCGLQHANMGFSVTAESAADFANWQQQQLKPAPEPANAEESRGREVFLTHACIMCHTIRGTSAGSRMGPDLTHVASRNMIAAETLPNTVGNLSGWILDPQQVKPGNHMSPNSLAPEELQALTAYLDSLR